MSEWLTQNGFKIVLFLKVSLILFAKQVEAENLSSRRGLGALKGWPIEQLYGPRRGEGGWVGEIERCNFQKLKCWVGVGEGGEC